MWPIWVSADLGSGRYFEVNPRFTNENRLWITGTIPNKGDVRGVSDLYGVR